MSIFGTIIWTTRLALARMARTADIDLLELQQKARAEPAQVSLVEFFERLARGSAGAACWRV